MAQAADSLLIRDSDMARRLLRYDWSLTPLGPLEGWPEALKMAVGICLNSRFPMMIWWGPELTFIYNDAYAPMLGKRHPGALGNSASSVWAEIWPTLKPQVDAVMRGREATWNRGVHLRVERNGFPEDAWFTWSYSPIPDGKGGVGGVFNVCTEDTASVLAERERDRLAGHLQLALDAAQMGWWHFDPETEIATWDRKYKEIFGVTDDRLDGREALLHLHPDDRERVEKAVGAALDPHDPQPYSIDYRILRADNGEERWVLAHGLAIFEGEGEERRAISFSGTVLDITGRKHAENALRESEERLQLAIAISGLGTFDIDLRTDAVKVNQTGRLIYGWPPDEPLTFSRVQTHFHPDDREYVMKEVEAALNPEGSGGFEVVQRILRTDGEVRWIRVKGRVSFGRIDGQRRPLRCIGTYLDITDSKQLEQERESLLESERAARSEAERVGRMKDEFLATLSHELRTPLNAIMGWTQVLQMKAPDPERLKTGLKSIENNSRLQARLIADLLEMSRIISGKVRLDMRSVRLQDVVDQAIEAARPVAEAKNIRLSRNVPAEPAVVWGDPNRLQQVLWNLLSNAIKFTPAGGEVRAALKGGKDAIEIGVTDTGQGIAPAFLPHVFERFRQADASITRTHGGLGLGLAIVKQLVELHGGSVRADSPGPGLGSTFTVALPQIAARRDDFSDLPAQADEALPKAPVADIPKLSGARILIVDDHDDARFVLQQLLELNDARVIPAASGAEALEKLDAESPDLLICDIGMPEMDGYELIRRVRALPPERGGQTPAVALTAFARREDRERALAVGYQSHLAKPVEPAKLLTACATLTQPHDAFNA